MRAAFGKVNTMHNHVLPWADRPLVNQNLLGGEDGIDDAGVSISHILPAPKGLFLDATAQVFRGDSDNVFAATQRSHVSSVGHLHGYTDLSDSTNLDFGFSYSQGDSYFAPGHNKLWGTDLAFRWKPLRRAIYHSFVARNEFVWSRAQAPGAVAKPFGYYVSGDYQFARRWFIGARFDRSQRGQCLPTNPETSSLCSLVLPVSYRGNYPLVQDTGGSAILTYWPSEFSQIRAQYRHTNYGDALPANELFLQLMFSIGAHGAHPF
jgi:hypothetical protein